jgi:hypothetical protein
MAAAAFTYDGGHFYIWLDTRQVYLSQLSAAILAGESEVLRLPRPEPSLNLP